MTPDPWALLKEARDFMREIADSRGPCPDCTECDRRDAIISKASVALTERETSLWYAHGYEGTMVRDTLAWTMKVTPRDPFRYHWCITQYSTDEKRMGQASTMTEAKQAATKAAQELGHKVGWRGSETHLDAYSPLGKMIVERDHSEGVWRWKTVAQFRDPRGRAATKEEAQAAAIAALEAAHGNR